MIKKVFTLAFFLLLLFKAVDAQQAKSFNSLSNYAVQASYQNGYVFSTNDFVRGVNAERDTIDNFQTFSVKILKQTTGEKLWEQLYNYPEYGLGVYVADFQNPEEIGNPIALYGYFKAPFYRWKRVTINYELGAGVAFNWKSYSPANPYNIAIGAPLTVYLDLGANAQFQLTNRLFADIGFSLTHFSNGKLKSPNYGLNTIAPKVSLKYKLNKETPEFIKQNVQKYKPKNELYISAYTGIKNILYDSLNIDASEKYEGESYYIFGISSVINRQISYKSKIGLGFSMSYNGSVDAQVAVDNGELRVTRGSFSEHLQLSIYPSYELVINKFSVVIQPSVYLYRKKLKNQTPLFYQRVGLKYNMFHNFYVGVNLRAYNFYVSDFIEWNVGYSFH